MPQYNHYDNICPAMEPVPGRCRGRVGFKGTPAEYWKMRNAILLKETPDIGMLLPYFYIEPPSTIKEGVKWGEAGILGGKKNQVILYEDQCKNSVSTDGSSALCDKCSAKQEKFKAGSRPMKCHWEGIIGTPPPNGSVFIGSPQLVDFTN